MARSAQVPEETGRVCPGLWACAGAAVQSRPAQTTGAVARTSSERSMGVPFATMTGEEQACGLSGGS
ncbi:hypothetical protein GCM10023257_10930 [Streptomyces hyderabadensis]|uniref:Uncharacterized protein n=1 Tax=Streptomyces hyderabadensis TaxID=598549 RepID=A0ABP9HPR7_9ACTN